MMDIYIHAMKKKGFLLKASFDLRYSYDSFDNERPIENIHRKIYTGLVAKGEKIKNPFSTEKNGYYYKLKKVGLIKKNNFSDKSTIKSISNVGWKLKFLNFLFTVLLRLIGSTRYQLLIRLLPRLSRFESQVFLVNKKFYSDNLYFG
jgi:hypothetical protein